MEITGYGSSPCIPRDVADFRPQVVLALAPGELHDAYAVEPGAGSIVRPRYVHHLHSTQRL